MIVSVLIVYPHGCVAAQPHESIVLPITSLRKDSDSKFEVWFLLNVYHFHTTVKSEKWNHSKSGTI